MLAERKKQLAEKNGGHRVKPVPMSEAPTPSEPESAAPVDDVSEAPTPSPVPEKNTTAAKLAALAVFLHLN